MALANCNGLLIRACDELERESHDVDLALRVMHLRERRARLIDELVAVVTEWAP